MPYLWPISLSDCAADLNITGPTNDGELQTVIDAATAVLENHPGYVVADHVKATEYEEWYDAVSPVMLKHYPVSSVTSVVGWSGATSQAFTEAAWDSGLTPDYGYALEGAPGLLHLTGSWSGRLLVTYTAGSVDVPADLRLAALVLVEHLWETQRGGNPGLPSGSDIDNLAPDFTLGSSFILPNRVREILEPYRKAPAVA